MIQPQVLTVTELTEQIKHKLEEPMFKNIALEGEVSNFKHHSSGHMYFTVKDQNSRIKAVMFRSRNLHMNFSIGNGDTIIAIGSLGVYETNGEYQIYVDQILPLGLGELHIKFEEMKKRLEQEGLFASEHKQDLPYLPRRIAVVTSPTSAAVRDVLSVIKRRFPPMDMLVVPAIVQGTEAPGSIIKALEYAATQDKVDLIILTRGGGSIEELWAFNDEQVARVIYNCPLPVISGVGHETDFTITDFVADRRAATPSAAAELAVPDYANLKAMLEQQTTRLAGSLGRLVETKRSSLGYLTNRNIFLRPTERMDHKRQKIDELLSRAQLVLGHQQDVCKQKLAIATGKLDSLSPLATLARGYAVCQKQDQSIVTDYSQVETGEEVSIRVNIGRLICEVKKGELANNG